MAATDGTGSPAVVRAGRFVWLTARVLEQRRFALHFLGGGPDPVEAALAAYRNEDGGYGHALDPDLRGPASAPTHVPLALRVLEETGRCAGRVAEALCRYLVAVSTAEGGLPAGRATPPDHPAAPWIPVRTVLSADLRVTGHVLAALHRNDVWHPWLFRATDFCWAAVEALEAADAYEALAALAFLDAVPDQARARRAADRLGRLVRERDLAVLDPAPVGSSDTFDERHFAHDFAPSPASLGRGWFSDAEIDRSLAFLSDAQRDDGGWPARRPQWSPAALTESRPIATMEALLTLRRYGRLA
jgi:hypothetical protein